MTERCKGRILQWAYPCPYKAIRDGYCKIHHPDAVKRRSQKSDARYKEQAAEWDVKYVRLNFDKCAGD
ncbi:hypothetical protein LCGC14_3124860, partial [marine sediment metagenome]